MALRLHMVIDPPSAATAARLEAEGATCCEHGRNPCALRCGVRCAIRRLEDRTHREGNTLTIEAVYEKTGPWRVIPYEERLATLTRLGSG